MLQAEKAVDQYFGESLDKWNKIEVPQDEVPNSESL